MIKILDIITLVWSVEFHKSSISSSVTYYGGIILKNSVLMEKILESAKAILPMAVLGFFLSVWISVDSSDLINFVIGVVMLILGLALFQIGSYSSTITIAEDIGGFLTRKKNLLLFIGVVFILGFMITVAEPQLWVLSDQLKIVIPPLVLIVTVALGVGVIVVMAILRILFQISLQKMFMVFYIALFVLAAIVSMSSPDFIPVAFDSGGVTTGPMVFSFIMALGYGISHARGDKYSELDSFGLIGLISVGPILSVLVLGLFYNPTIPIVDTSSTIIDYLLINLVQMAIAILPFVIFFFIFQIIAFKLPKVRVYKILVSFLYTYLGLVLFLTGANGGLVNIGTYIGEYFGENYKWFLIPIGMIFGFIVVAAEPAVIPLNRQVEEVSAGAISRKIMMVALSVGVSIAVGLSLLRVVTGLNIWWILVPGYVITILLTFITPKIFSSIAIDSGAAVSGTLATGFLMPFALGASMAIPDSNPLTDAFGLIAFIAMTPLITIQIVGILAQRKKDKLTISEIEDDIIDLKGEKS